MAGSWSINEIGAVYAACSPHRVALCIRHLREFYLDEFVDQLVALLPDWARWLAEPTGLAPELADRCLPYAQGEPFPQLGEGDAKPHYLARVIE